MAEDRINNIPDEAADTEDVELIVLTDDEGNEERFEFLDMINYSGTDYAVLVPEEGSSDEDDQVYIFRVDDADQETNTLTPVTDEKTAMAIFELFKVKNQENFNFT